MDIMSEPAPAPAPVPETPPPQPAVQTGGGLFSIIAGGGLFTGILTFIFTILFGLGASRLSYVKYGSVMWAIVDFFFASLYYPYYALVLNEPCSPMAMLGGRRRK
jgi:hypothetical protein